MKSEQIYSETLLGLWPRRYWLFGFQANPPQSRRRFLWYPCICVLLYGIGKWPPAKGKVKEPLQGIARMMGDFLQHQQNNPFT